MKTRLVLMTAALLAASLGAMPAASSGGEVQGVLAQGSRYVLHRDPQIAAAAVSLWFRAPSDGYANATPGIARLAATAAAAATLASGRSLADMVHQAGGTLSIQVYPDIVGVEALVPASMGRRIVAAMTAAYFTPTITAAALSTAQRDTSIQTIEQRYASADVLHNALFARIFASGPAHTAPIPDSPDALMHIKLPAVQAFALRAFAASNANVALAGNIDTSSLSAIAGAPAAPAPAPPFDSTLAAAPAAAGVSSVVASVSGIGLAWVGPPIQDKAAATAFDFIADYLFRDGTGTVAKAVDADGNTFVTGQFITLHNPGVMLVTIDGAHPNAAKQRVLAALDALAQPMDATAFAAARNAFLYHLAIDTQTPDAQANNLGWYAAEGDVAYAPGSTSGEYRALARALTPNFVASVVKEYLTQPVIVRLMPESAKESST